MGYAKEYCELFTQSGFEKVKALLEAGEAMSYYQWSEFKLEEHCEQKYFSVVINTEKNEVTFSAYLQVSYLPKKDLFPNANDGEVFPLFFIVRPSTIKECALKYYNKDVTLQHELTHLKDLMELFDNDPGFISRGAKYAFTNVKRLDHISKNKILKCIDYEVEKIFKVEPHAMKLDFESGEKTVMFPGLSSIIEYECKSCAEYIKTQVYSYLFGIKNDVITSVKGNNKLVLAVQTTFAEAINKYGKVIFGEHNAHTNFLTFEKELSLILLSHIRVKEVITPSIFSISPCKNDDKKLMNLSF